MYRNSTDKRVKKSGDQLFSAICMLMITKNFDDIGIKELSIAAGVGRATFYRNFDYVDDVLKLQVDQHLQELQLTFDPQVDEATNDLGPFFQFWIKNNQILKILAKADKWEIFSIRFEQSVMVNLSQFSEKLGFSELEFEYFRKITLGMLSSVLHTWVERGAVEDASQLHNMMELPFTLYKFRRNGMATF